MRLAAAGWLACSNDPKNYAGRNLMLLAGPTKPDRSLGEGPDEACIPVLQARRFGLGLTTRNCPKKDTVTETAKKTSTTTVCNGLSESPGTYISGSSESKKEATDRKKRK